MNMLGRFFSGKFGMQVVDIAFKNLVCGKRVANWFINWLINAHSWIPCLYLRIWNSQSKLLSLSLFVLKTLTNAEQRKCHRQPCSLLRCSPDRISLERNRISSFRLALASQLSVGYGTPAESLHLPNPPVRRGHPNRVRTVPFLLCEKFSFFFLKIRLTLPNAVLSSK